MSEEEAIVPSLMNESTGHSNAQEPQEEEGEEDEDLKVPAKRSFFRHLKTTMSRSMSPSPNNRAKKAAAKTRVFFWPQNLPEACTRARVMTFGYDSDVSKFFGGAPNKNTFYDHASDLLGALVRKRTRVVCIMPTQYCPPCLSVQIAG